MRDARVELLQRVPVRLLQGLKKVLYVADEASQRLCITFITLYIAEVCKSYKMPQKWWAGTFYYNAIRVVWKWRYTCHRGVAFATENIFTHLCMRLPNTDTETKTIWHMSLFSINGMSSTTENSCHKFVQWAEEETWRNYDRKRGNRLELSKERYCQIGLAKALLFVRLSHCRRGDCACQEHGREECLTCFG